MSCQSIRQSLIELGWDGTTRERAAEVLAHLEQCEGCRAAAEDLERLQVALRVDELDAMPLGGWNAFEERLRATVPESRPHRWRPLMAMAAMLLVGIGGGLLGQVIPLELRRPSTPRMQMVDFRPGEVAQQVQAFDEVSRVFDRKASWILLANGSSDMGLSSEPVIDQKLLLLRLVMSHAGAAISTADLVIVPGQKADLTVPVGRGQSLHYQVATSVRDPNRLSLWAELQTPQGDRPLASLATTLDLRPGEKLTAGQLVTSAGPYELSIAFSRSALPEGHR